MISMCEMNVDAFYRGVYIYEEQGVHETKKNIWNCHNNHLIFAVCIDQVT